MLQILRMVHFQAQVSGDFNLLLDNGKYSLALKLGVLAISTVSGDKIIRTQVFRPIR